MILRHHLCKTARPRRIPIAGRRWHSTCWLERRLDEPVQSYASTSRDPYLNLSIEHHLLQKSSPESTILFTYVNRPSIIIGRNQNPWLEVNLALVQPNQGDFHDEAPPLEHVDLVRRRSGGGTVFHDEGNVNWTVICPSANFTRDKHAEMVVRALRSCGADRSRVNERHDIVLDQGHRLADADPNDTHVTPYTDSSSGASRPLKVSGSAYKLTRGRALHHGTCLLSSPNLSAISKYLRSPAKSYIKARGVESVSSPVTNIGLSNDAFTAAVHDQFKAMYSPHTNLSTIEVGEGLLEIKAVQSGYRELQTVGWKWLQTPQFIISNTQDESRLADIELSVRHGVITEASVGPRDFKQSKAGMSAVTEGLVGLDLLENRYCDAEIWSQLSVLGDQGQNYVIGWLQKMLPNTGESRSREAEGLGSRIFYS